MLKSIKILLSIGAYLDYEIWQMDIITTFLMLDRILKSMTWCKKIWIHYSFDDIPISLLFILISCIIFYKQFNLASLVLYMTWVYWKSYGKSKSWIPYKYMSFFITGSWTSTIYLRFLNHRPFLDVDMYHLKGASSCNLGQPKFWCLRFPTTVRIFHPLSL